MGNKSRVDEYKKLREEIENIDVYSFDDPKKMPPTIHKEESIIPIHSLEYEDDFNSGIKEEVSDDHIKKNTLSLTMDEIIKQHEAYTEILQKQELDKKIKEKRVKRKISFDHTVLMWIIIGVCVVIAIVIIALVMAGVIHL